MKTEIVIIIIIIIIIINIFQARTSSIYHKFARAVQKSSIYIYKFRLAKYRLKK